jgi:predicted permease
VVAVVLLVACANVANLLLARAAARQRELTVRAAIGACRARLARQLLTESLLLAALGGAGGLLVARLGAAVLDGYARSAPAGSVMFGAAALALDLRPDARVLAFDGAVCLVTGVLFGLAPALRASRRLPVGLLVWRGSGASRATAAGRATGLRSSLVVGQIALSLVLLAGAALLVRSLHNIRASVAGFDREQLLLVWTLPGYGTRDRAASRALFAQVESRIAALPGVVSASPSVDGIFGASPASPIPTRPEGAGVAPLVHARGLMTVGPGFFRTVGQRLIAGRDFGAADADSSPRVVIVDEQLARRAFGTLDVLGRRVGIGGERSAPAYTVVGVVGDAKYASPHDAGGMLVYFPYAQSRNLARLCLVVRVSRGAEQVERAIREELRRIDPLLPVLEIDTVDEQLDHALSRDRLVTQLSLFFGGLAALLACVGLYGLVAYTTARRTSEIGVRVALGATRGGVLRLVLADGVRLVGTGIALGVAAAAGATRLVASRLYGIGAGDPLTIAGIAALLVAVAALATYLPARRAADADPTAALRVE